MSCSDLGQGVHVCVGGESRERASCPARRAAHCPHATLPPPTRQAPDKPTYIELEFEKGDPVKLDGVALSPAAMLTALNKVSEWGLGADRSGARARVRAGWC
jgi:argininosuccinate synthase